MNKVFETGRLVAIPQLSETSNGKKVARFTIAVRRLYSTNKNDADFLPCVIYDKQAEYAAKYGKSGMQVSVAGSIKTFKRNPEDKYTNAFNLELTDFEILSTKKEMAEYNNKEEVENLPNSGRKATQKTDKGTLTAYDIPEDMIPF